MMSIHPANVVRGLVCLLALSVVPAAMAQTRIPTENTLEDLQLFAPADTVNYGDKPYLKEGLFFTYDILAWSVRRPDAATVGDPLETRQVFDPSTFRTFQEVSTVDTGVYEDQIHSGYRVEAGFMTDCSGWLLGHTELHERTQRAAFSNTPVVFRDPQGFTINSFIQDNDGVDLDLDGDRVYGRDGEDLGTRDDTAPFPTPHPGNAEPAEVGEPGTVGRPARGPGTLGDGIRPGYYLPYDGVPDSFTNGSVPDFGDLVAAAIDFDDLVITNYTDMWGLELMSLRRLDQMRWGGHCELMAGVRYVDFNEQFHLEGERGILADTNINNEANNLMVGPQVGARWFRSCCRWTFAMEGRFTPAVNFQAVRLRSTIGDDEDDSSLEFHNTNFDSMHTYEFSPIGEVRLNWSYQLTRAIAVRGGYTALYIAGLARPSNMIDYVIPSPSLLRDNNYDDVFMQGINVGIEINR